jgi:hypothetical protein
VTHVAEAGAGDARRGLVRDGHVGEAGLRHVLLRAVRAGRAADGDDADTAYLRHARFWMILAEQSGRGFEGPEWRAWLDRSRAALNEFRAALAWTIARGHAEEALRTATALQGLWAFSNQHAEAHRWLTEALGPTALQRRHGPRLAAALALANHTGAEWRVGRLLQRAGFIATESGSYPEAQILLAEALPPALRAEDHQCVADIHGTRAIACLYAGDTEGAARAAAQQLTWRGASESPGSPTGC